MDYATVVCIHNDKKQSQDEFQRGLCLYCKYHLE